MDTAFELDTLSLNSQSISLFYRMKMAKDLQKLKLNIYLMWFNIQSGYKDKFINFLRNQTKWSLGPIRQGLDCAANNL